MKRTNLLKRIPAQLTVFLLIVFIPVIGANVFLQTRQRAYAQEDVKADQLRLVRLLAKDFDSIVESGRYVLMTLSQIDAVEKLDGPACAVLFAKQLANSPGFTGFSLSDKTGNVIASAPPISGTLSFSDRQWFQELLRTQEFTVGEYQIGRISGRPTLILRLPLMDAHGGVKGVVAVGIGLEWLSSTAADVQLPQGSTLTALDRNGTILFRSPDSQMWVGRSLPESPLVRQILAKTEGTSELPGVDGIHRLYGYTPLKSTGKTVGYLSVGIPFESVYGEEKRLYAVNIVVLLVIAVLSMIGAWVYSSLTIVRKTNALVRVAERLAVGDLNTPSGIDHNSGELGRLALAFDRMSESLKRQQEFQGTLLENLAEGVVACDEQGRLAFLNHVAQQWHALEALSVLPEVWTSTYSLYLPDGQTPLPKESIPLHRAFQGEQVRDVEIALAPQGQPTRHVLCSGGPLFDREGRKLGAVVVMYDITERRQAEQKLRESEAKFLQAQKMEAVGQLAGGVAHDFNNILTAIYGYSEIVRMKVPRDHPAWNAAAEILKAAERAAALTRQLLAFSRKQTLQLQVVSLNELIQKVRKMLERLIGEDVELKTAFAERLSPVKVDPNQIEQVLMNLAVNARDAMPRGGKLLLETQNVRIGEEYVQQHPGTPAGEYVMLAVSDNGTGMDKETQSHLFEPFFTTKELGKGTGLGLATVYGIVKQCGGSIWVYSEPGKGTTFKIYLPQVQEQAATLKVSTTPASEQLGGKETILLVEDDEVLRNLIVKVLEEKGYKVLAASNGEEALRTFGDHRGQLDLLITDVVMPKMNGREVAERLNQQRPGLKVLYMSGYTSNVIAHHNVLDSGVELIEKPVTVEALLRKIRELLG